MAASARRHPRPPDLDAALIQAGRIDTRVRTPELQDAVARREQLHGEHHSSYRLHTAWTRGTRRNLGRGDCAVLNEGPYIDEAVVVLYEVSAGWPGTAPRRTLHCDSRIRLCHAARLPTVPADRIQAQQSGCSPQTAGVPE